MKIHLASCISTFLGETVTHKGNHLVEATIFTEIGSLRRRWMRTSKQWPMFVVLALEGIALKQVPQRLSGVLYSLLVLPSLLCDSLSSFHRTSWPWSAAREQASFRALFGCLCPGAPKLHPKQVDLITGGQQLPQSSSFLADLPESHGDWGQCYSGNYEL